MVKCELRWLKKAQVERLLCFVYWPPFVGLTAGSKLVPRTQSATYLWCTALLAQAALLLWRVNVLCLGEALTLEKAL